MSARKRGAFVVALLLGALALAVWVLHWAPVERAPLQAPDSDLPAIDTATNVDSSAALASRGSSEEEPSSRVALPSAPEREQATLNQAHLEDASRAGSFVTLLGHVVEADGSPLLDGRQISIAAIAVGRPSRSKPLSADGSFEFAGLETGDWWITASGRGRIAATRSITLVPGDPPEEIELVLERKPLLRILVKTLEGEAFTNVLRGPLASPMWRPTVFASEGPSPDQTSGTEPSNEIARYWPLFDRSDLAAGCIGELELFREPPLYISLSLAGKTLAQQFLNERREEVSFVLDSKDFLTSTSGLRLVVVDGPTGIAAGGARVELHSSHLGTRGGVAKADGSHEIVPWPAGDYLLDLRAANHLGIVQELVLPPGEILDLGSIGLQPAAPLRVHVVGAENRRGIQVYCKPKRELEDRYVWSGSLSFQPNAEGEFEVPLSEGQEILWAEQDGTPGRKTRPIVVHSQQAGERIEIQLLEMVSLTILPRRAAERSSLELRDALQVLLASPSEIGPTPVRYDLLPGPYRLAVGRGPGAREVLAIELGSMPLEITLE